MMFSTRIFQLATDTHLMTMLIMIKAYIMMHLMVIYRLHQTPTLLDYIKTLVLYSVIYVWVSYH